MNQRHTIAFSMICLAVSLALTATADRLLAHGGGGDIALFSTEGQVDVGFAILDDDDEEQVFFDPEESVFLSVLVPLTPNEVVPWEFGSPEPGFDANEETLTESAEITVDLLGLSFWDGQGDVAFSPASGLNGGYAPQPMQSFPDGGFHSHPFFGVEDPAGDVAEGVYRGQVRVNVEGLASSAPYYMVSLVAPAVNAIADEEEQTAAAEAIGELVRNYLNDPVGNPAPVYEEVDYTYFADAVAHVRTLAVPEPGTVSLAVIAALAWLAARLRRSAS